MATRAVATKKAASSANIVSIQEELKRQAAAIGDKIAPPGGDVIQITQDKRFKLPDGTVSAGPLAVVIVDFVSANYFYEGAYDANNITPPACFALGHSPTTLAPSANSPLKQSETCAGCPMNQFGSSGNGKACKNSRVLAVLPPDADENTPLWVLKVSPTALKAFDTYVGSIARTLQTAPVGVVTEVSFDDNVTYASLRFGNPMPNKNIAAFFHRREEAMKRLMTEPDVSQFGTAQPPKKAAASGRGRR